MSLLKVCSVIRSIAELKSLTLESHFASQHMQNRQYMCNVTLRRVVVTIVAVETNRYCIL